MNAQLKWKFILIAAIVLICIFGIIGFPASWSQLRNNIADRIHLGLDLKGGSHLVLQVQLQEAIGQHCDETVDELTKQLHAKNIGFGEIRRIDDTHILLRNIESTSTSSFRDLVSGQFTDWAISPAAGENNGY